MSGLGHKQMDQAARDAQIVLDSPYYRAPISQVARAFQDYRRQDSLVEDAWTRRMLTQWLSEYFPSAEVWRAANNVLAFYRRHGWITPAEKGWYSWAKYQIGDSAGGYRGVEVSVRVGGEEVGKMIVQLPSMDLLDVDKAAGITQEQWDELQAGGSTDISVGFLIEK